MAADMLWLHTLTFLLWTVGVGIITWIIVHWYFPQKTGASDDYFAGGRALSWYIVAGSLMLTNLSTEQLVGLNGNIFLDGCLGGTAWETFAALAMCATATCFLPKYMQSGLATTTGFLGERFNLLTRTMVSMVFLVYYAVGLCPIVLYTGAIAFRKIFDLGDVPLWMISAVIGLIGSGYAIFGGLKAVAISDCLNGIGLLIVGVWVPVAALQKLGGLSVLFAEPEYLRPLVETSNVYSNDLQTRTIGVPTVPWHVIVTGLMLQNLYYWSTNQLIVQRALAARSLAEGQKGVLFAASMKVVGFMFLCLPGIIGAIMVKNGVEIDGKPFDVQKADEVYPELVKVVMPTWSLGFFAGVLLGSILSTFNSALNSAATLFGLEVYKIYVNPDATEERTVRVATGFGTCLTVAALIIAPQFEHVESIFDLLQKIKTIASLPVITTFLVGIFSKLPDAFAAQVGFIVGAVAYGVAQFLDEPHYLHRFFVCFLLSLLTMMAGTYVPAFRRCFCQAIHPVPYVEKFAPVVDMTQWFGTWPTVSVIVGLVTMLTVSLQISSLWLFYAFWLAWAIGTATLLLLPSRQPLAESKLKASAPVTEIVEEPDSNAAGESNTTDVMRKAPDAPVVGLQAEQVDV